MINWWKALFAWRQIRDTGLHSYEVNDVTGARRIVRRGYGGHQSIDRFWLQTGEWFQPGRPPNGVVAKDA